MNFAKGVFAGLAMVCGAVAAQAGGFVVNGDFGAGNTGFTSAAAYKASGSLSYAEYAVRTNPATANGSWCGADHTTGSGNMLLVDSVVGPAWEQTIVLEPGGYAFSAWAMNVLCPQNSPLTQPVLSLRINGVTLAGPANIAQVSGVWVSLSCGFDVTTTGPVTLQVWSSEGAINGADFALDDICVEGVVASEEKTWGAVKALYR